MVYGKYIFIQPILLYIDLKKKKNAWQDKIYDMIRYVQIK